MSAHPRRVPDRKLQSYSMSREQAEEDLLHGNVRADAAGAGGVVGVVPAAGVGAGVRRAAACHDRGGLAPRCWVITPMLLSYNFVVQYKQNKEGEFKKEQASNIEKFKPPRKKIVKLDKVEDTKAGNHKISSSKTKEINLVTESDLACQRIWKSIDQHLIPENLRSPRAVAEWRRTGIIPEMKKRKINDNDATSTDGANANSQAAQC